MTITDFKSVLCQRKCRTKFLKYDHSTCSSVPFDITFHMQFIPHELNAHVSQYIYYNLSNPFHR